MHLRDTLASAQCAQKLTRYGRVEVCHAGASASAYDVYMQGHGQGRTVQRTHCATVAGVEWRMAALGINVTVEWSPVDAGSHP
jgi:hypothetical protein